MEYGHFSTDGREYIITKVDTPAPWINYLYNGRYFTFISGNGGGMSYYKSPLHGRVTRYRINDVPPDRPGKYIYVRDADSGEVWSLTWQPMGRDLAGYTVAHGFGYTRAEARVADIASSVLYFVPPADDQEIWRATLRNESAQPRRLDVFAYVEFALGHALVDLINQCDDQHFNRAYFDHACNTLFASKTYWVTQTGGTQQQENKEWDQWAFFTCSEPVRAYETQRERFIGPFRSERDPLALEQGTLASQDSDFGNVVGALQIQVELQPGEEKTVVFSLGVIAKTEFAAEKMQRTAKFADLTIVDAAFADLQANWASFLHCTRVETPDANANIFMNYWTPYQAKVAFDVGRVASYYYWGIGRGFGFRDTAQDVLAIVIADRQCAQERVRLLARQIFKDGHVYHHFYGDGHGECTGHCDDPLWFILAVSEYIKESGDLVFLDAIEPFADGGHGTILEHLLAVAAFAEGYRGTHDLPIFGRGDWNDTLDYIGGDDGGESVWGAMFYCAMLNRLQVLLQMAGKTVDLDRLDACRERLQTAIETHCWDGEWYIRAFGGQNRRIGAAANAAGKIFINTQSWAVLADLPQRERQLRALASVQRELECEYGPKICSPAFRAIDPTIGLITRCVPGKKENGAVFCHPVTWLIIAECILGHGERAFAYYAQLLPNRVPSDIFCAEPYVYSQYITSNEHAFPGKASHSWQTGTAAWMFRAVYDYILGVKATYAGLHIDPVIPAAWPQFYCERVYRGTRYCITVRNPEHVERGVRAMTVDGQALSGQLLPLALNERCMVDVVLGKTDN